MSDDSGHHIPVMVQELLDVLDLKQSNTVIDATYGFGGHAEVILDSLGSEGRLIGIERDERVLERARKHCDDPRVTLLNSSYSELNHIVSDYELNPDAIYFDLGISSFHLDEPGRGFSFQHENDLFDCRFSTSESDKPAWKVINSSSRSEIGNILEKFGEVRRKNGILDSLLENRPVKTVKDIKESVEAVVRPDRINSELARVFQAFRIYVNNELENLKRGLKNGLECLKEGGRIAALSYHSLEDKIIKDFFRYEARECVCPPDLPKCACQKVKRCEVVEGSPFKPTDEEVEENPRARSALLRAARRF